MWRGRARAGAVLTRRAVSRGSRAPGAGHLGHSIDELRRQAARAISHERARARAGERGGTGARRPPHVAAQVSINRCAASARARRGRGTFMSREQLTAEPRKHESGRLSAPLCTPRPAPAPRTLRSTPPHAPVLTYSAQGAAEHLHHTTFGQIRWSLSARVFHIATFRRSWQKRNWLAGVLMFLKCDTFDNFLTFHFEHAKC